MTTTAKANDASQLLAMVPPLIGYQPVESVVIVPFNDRRSLGAMRFDVEKFLSSPNEATSTALGLTAKVEGVTAFFAVVYTEHVDQVKPALVAFDKRAREIGLSIFDLAYVSSTEWALFSEGKARSLDELDTSIVPATVAKPSGGVLDGTELPTLSETQVHLMQRTAQEYARSFGSVDDEAHSIAVAMIPSVASALLNVAPEDFEISEHIVGWATEVFLTPALRDVAFVTWMLGLEAGEQALTAQLDWQSGAEYPAEFAAPMWGQGATPTPQLLKLVLELARTAAAAAADDKRKAAALGVAAWYSWALGLSSHAGHYATLSLELDPEYGLSEIVEQFVHVGHLPEWVFTGRTQ
jgi:hypothetical protein